MKKHLFIALLALSASLPCANLRAQTSPNPYADETDAQRDARLTNRWCFY